MFVAGSETTNIYFVIQRYINTIDYNFKKRMCVKYREKTVMSYHRVSNTGLVVNSNTVKLFVESFGYFLWFSYTSAIINNAGEIFVG